MPRTVNSNQKVPLDQPPTSGPEAVVKNTLARHKQLKSKKDPWLDQYQLLGEFIHMRKQEFQSEHTVGEFLTREIFNATGPQNAETSASTLISLMWPASKNKIKLNPPMELEGTREEKEYYEFVTKTLLRVMDDPKAGFGIATDEYMLDQVVFGTSSVETVRDPDTKVRYTSWGISHIYIDEGKNRSVDTVYMEILISNQKLVKDYGLENVSEKTKEEFNNGKFDIEKTVVIAIEPRISKIQGKEGNKNMPFSSVHIEVDAKHLLRESGFEEMPIAVGRASKLFGEVYGRSFGMKALPAILELNAIWESVTVAIEKSLDPPLGVYSDSVLGGGEIDTSAGAINVFNPADQAKDRQPIFQLFTVGEFKQIVALVQSLNEEIGNYFLIDRLLDFNNETRMTATEATIRDRMRNSTLSRFFNRQFAEYFIPQIERTFNILLADDELGVVAGSSKDDGTRFIIPETIANLMAEGKDVFDLVFSTPATRIMQSEEAESMLRQAEYAGLWTELGKVEILDNQNIDASYEIFSNIIGAPTETTFAKLKVKQDRDARAAQEADLAEQEQVKTVTQGIQAIGNSGLVPTEKPKESA